MSAQADKADRSRDALEEEIEQAREGLVDSVDAIAERLNPRDVAERTTEQAKRDARRKVEAAKDWADEDPRRAKALVAGVIATLLAPVLVSRFLDRRR